MENFKPDIDKALEVLRAGGIILYPTDTVWGIGCDATNETAVAKIFNLKNRAEQQSMLILTDNINRISTYADDVPEVALDLMEIADQPTTVIFSNAKNIAKNLIAPDGSVGIRIPDDAFCQQLLERFKKPIVSTSANISGQPTPKYFSEISENVKSGVDYVVSWRQNERKQAKASGIIKITPDSTITIIRK